ncbi:hypothetical protein KOR34_16390 [Posidoniimonas corsicana]|uniref:Uncharacterized protein n=1 Tax=Posidoniimonas corsicana TaxID=1938618 RepID=A0A5C5VFL9_9BACT|nr:hypothetical protein [Posidoniimonas corsicana]TWT36699.1 hypothetical protein KOR34_16390 [Posidoniimonas corsicana]
MTRFVASRRGRPPLSAAWLCPLAAACCLALGCGRSGEDLESKVLRAANLEGARRSSLPELVDLVTQIENSHEAPADLSADPVPDDVNAAAVLASELTDAVRLRMLPQLEVLLTFERGRPSDEQLATAADLLRDEAPLVDLVRQASAKPRCASGVRFERGFFDRYRLLDDATLAARLHLVAAHVALADGDRTAMLDELGLAAKWINWLAQERRLEPRLLAAQLRRQWFAAVAVALAKPAPNRDYVAVFDQLRGQLRTWPSDRDALVGDRAITLHAYEAIRLGLLDRVITIDEKKKLSKDGRLDELRAMDQSAIDQDELTYLKTMTALVDLADDPYHRRVEEMSAVLAQAAPDSPAAARAPLATGLFLVGVGDAIEALARDRAITEGWLLTLASAADFDLPPYRISPLTGRPYEAARDAQGVVMQLNDLSAPNPRVAAPLDGGR